MNYLKEEKYYIDLYDLNTIKECLDWYWKIRDGLEKKRDDINDVTPEQFAQDVHKASSYVVNAIKGERYRHRATTINEWIERDTKKQKKYDNTLPPKRISCMECNGLTKVVHKSLHDPMYGELKMLFMFECIKCKKCQAIYEDGEKWVYEPQKCPKCEGILQHKTDDSEDVLTTTYSCTNCPYLEIDKYDFKKSKEEREKKELMDKKLLEEYREEFCLDEKNGPEYIRSLDAMVAVVDKWKEREKKEADPSYQKAKNLTKLTVVELQDLLCEALKKDKYINLTFDKPDINKHVVIPFMLQDADESRNNYESTKALQKLLKNTLEGTNWRLMSEGSTYRLGYLYGRLKGYENEDDLINLFKKKSR